MCLDSSMSEVQANVQQVSVANCAAGQSGGGVYIYGGIVNADTLQVDACSAVDGAGIAAIDTVLSMERGGASANVASGDGGGVWAVDSSVLVQTAFFQSNQAVYGGALMLDWCSDVLCLSTTLESNQAVLRGGALYAAGVSDFDTAVEMCAVRLNSAGLGVDGVVFADGNAGRVSDSLFCGQAQHVGGTWTDLGGNTFDDQCAVTDCPGDVDDSGVVGLGDISVLLFGWGDCSDTCDGDIDGNGAVDVQDLIEVLMRWGESC